MATAAVLEPKPQPSALERFFEYMRDFEMAWMSGDWSLLESHFHEDARHEIEGGALPIGVGGQGRAAVIAGLRGGAEGIDRRFDARIPEIVEGPVTRPDGVWMSFALTLRRKGLPALCLRGEHLVEYRDGRIVRLAEKVAPGESARVAAFLAEHDTALKAPGSAFEPPQDVADLAALEAATGRSMVRCYGGAKSEQDVGAALAVCDASFSIETLAFGIESRDREDTRAQLEGFFASFPDYGVTLEGFADAPGIVTCWGRARLTFGRDFLGQAATGQTADLPIFCVFDLAGPFLTRERFFFDRADFCEQTGLAPTTLQALRP